jgi:hypothetical protein
VANEVSDWLAEAEALAALLETYPRKLRALADLPKVRDAGELLPALLRARRSFGLASPNVSMDPAGDKAALAPEHLRHPLTAVYRNIESGIVSCVHTGAREPSIICAADFGPSGLQTVDAPGVVGRVLLGRLSALGESHPLRKALPLSEGYVPTGGGPPCVVLGRLLGGGFPGDPLPVRPGAWYDLTEAVTTTRWWQQSVLAREAERLRQEERDRLDRQSRAAGWKDAGRPTKDYAEAARILNGT